MPSSKAIAAFLRVLLRLSPSLWKKAAQRFGTRFLAFIWRRALVFFNSSQEANQSARARGSLPSKVYDDAAPIGHTPAATVICASNYPPAFAIHRSEDNAETARITDEALLDSPRPSLTLLPNTFDEDQLADQRARQIRSEQGSATPSMRRTRLAIRQLSDGITALNTLPQRVRSHSSTYSRSRSNSRLSNSQRIRRHSSTHSRPASRPSSTPPYNTASRADTRPHSVYGMQTSPPANAADASLNSISLQGVFVEPRVPSPSVGADVEPAEGSIHDPPRDSSIFLPIPPDAPKSPSIGANRFITEKCPADLPRYRRKTFAVIEKPSTYTSEALTTHFPHSNKLELKQPWIALTHPEGALYFYHPEKKVYTDTYIYSQDYLQEVEDAVEYLNRYMGALKARGQQVPEDYELVIHVSTPDLEDALEWQYYYIDHQTSSVFWLRECCLDEHLCGVKGIDSPAHVYLLIQSWYWLHIMYFPDSRGNRPEVDRAIIGRLSSIVQFCIADVIVASTSTYALKLLELQQMSAVLEHVERQSKDFGRLTPEGLASLALVQHYIFNWQYIQAHGQREARLSINDSIYGLDPKRTWLIRLVSPVLFFSPEANLYDLEMVNIDGVISTLTWHKFFQKLLDEWKDLIFQGTVILTANVSFLAIPNVVIFPDNTPQPIAGSNVQSYAHPLRSSSALFSYLSTLVGLASVMIGLLLARRHRAQTEVETDARAASEYLERHRSRWVGLEALAIVYSLPFSLLIWATALFLAALLCYTFALVSDDLTRIVVGVCASLVVILIVWSVVVNRRIDHRASYIDIVLRALHDGWDAVAMLSNPFSKRSKSSVAMEKECRGRSRSTLRSA